MKAASWQSNSVTFAGAIAFNFEGKSRSQKNIEINSEMPRQTYSLVGGRGKARN
jgi:hypothetical protein